MKNTQKQTIIQELKQLENNVLSGVQTFKKLKHVELMESPYTDDKFMKIDYVDVLDDGSPVHKLTYTRIDSTGKAHPQANKTMPFKTLADRVHFFNTLTKIVL